MRPILLDTCAILWIIQDQPLSDPAKGAMDAAWIADEPVLISPISAWEIGMLTAKGRLALAMPAQQIWSRILESPGFREAELSAAILLASCALPGDRLRDPADRILAATAREHGYRLMTRDRPILAFAQAGHVQAIAC